MHFLLVAAALQAATPTPAPILPTNRPAALDRLLAERDYGALATIVRSSDNQEDLVSDLDWLKSKVMSGESPAVAILYARLLWDSTEDIDPAAQRENRKNVAIAILYADSAISIDGLRCEDGSAPGNRRAQLAMMLPKLPAFIARLNKAERQSMVGTVAMLERDTAARRASNPDIDYLCSSGMDEMAYNIDHGTTNTLLDQPGGWRHVKVTGDGSYKPKLVPEATWQAESAKVRAKLPQSLSQLVEHLSRPTKD